MKRCDLHFFCFFDGHRILVVGCGASKLSIELYEAGFTNITNIDISEVVINHNRKKYGQLEGMTCKATYLMPPQFQYQPT